MEYLLPKYLPTRSSLVRYSKPGINVTTDPLTWDVLSFRILGLHINTVGMRDGTERTFGIEQELYPTR